MAFSIPRLPLKFSNTVGQWLMYHNQVHESRSEAIYIVSKVELSNFITKQQTKPSRDFCLSRNECRHLLAIEHHDSFESFTPNTCARFLPLNLLGVLSTPYLHLKAFLYNGLLAASSSGTSSSNLHSYHNSRLGNDSAIVTPRIPPLS